MSEDYIVRSYRSGDEGQIVKLLRLVFDGWPHFDLNCSPLDHWRWKYQENPLKASCVAVGVYKNEIIGTVQEFLLKIKIGDEVFISSYGGDVAVHPDFRRMGIHQKMVELVRQQRKEIGSKFAYLVTQNPIIIKNLSKKQRRFPRPILNLVRIRDIGRQLQAMPVENAWLRKLSFQVAMHMNSVKNAVKGSMPANNNLCIKRAHIFDARIDLFWKELADHYEFIIERRSEYLNWRYCDPRSGDFVVSQVEDDGGRILGYSVLRINRYLGEYPIGYLVDLLALPSRLDVAEALVIDAVRYFDEQNINIVNSLVVKNHPYKKILHRYGFLDSRIKLQLFLSSASQILDELNALETFASDRMYFSYGDIDSLPARMPNNR